jgi:hypothetical protein
MSKRRREPSDADRLRGDADRFHEVLTVCKHSLTQDIRARAEELRVEAQQITDRVEEVSKRIAKTGIVTERDHSQLEAINAEAQELEGRAGHAFPPFPRPVTLEEDWDQSGQTDMTALLTILAPFTKARLPALCGGLKEVEARRLVVSLRGLFKVLARQHQTNLRDRIRWLLVFEGHYARRLPWRAAYEYASKRLAGTSAAGGKYAMEVSYKMFARRSKNMVG